MRTKTDGITRKYARNVTSHGRARDSNRTRPEPCDKKLRRSAKNRRRNVEKRWKIEKCRAVRDGKHAKGILLNLLTVCESCVKIEMRISSTLPALSDKEDRQNPGVLFAGVSCRRNATAGLPFVCFFWKREEYRLPGIDRHNVCRCAEGTVCRMAFLLPFRNFLMHPSQANAVFLYMSVFGDRSE